MPSYGSIQLHDGTIYQVLLGMARKLKHWTANGQASSSDQGSTAIVPDYVNSRIKVKPGTYWAIYRASGQLTNYDITVVDLNLYKNGAKVKEIGCELNQYADPTDFNVCMEGILDVTVAESDVNHDVFVDVRGTAALEESSSSSSSSLSSSSSSSTNSSSSSSSSSTSSSSSSSNSSSSSSSSSSTNSSSSSSSTNSSSSSSSSSSQSSSSSSSQSSSSSSSSSSGDESSSSSSSSSSSGSSSSSSQSSSSSSSSSSVTGGVRLTIANASLTLIGLNI